MTESTAGANVNRARFDAHLNHRDFERFSKLVYEQCGIRLPQHKRSMLESRLRKRLREHNLLSFEDYAAMIFDGEIPVGEIVKLIDVVTTNKTDFFREPAHFDFLTKQALPLLTAEGRGTSRNPLRLWSAGCSTGKEPYTLAMILQEFQGHHPDFTYHILGTDISTDVLEKARVGIYHQDKAIPIPAPLRKKYLLKSKNTADKLVRIIPELRSKVHFARLNFMQEHFDFDEPFDVIFCRNVMIYFDRSTQEKLLAKLAGCLAPGRFLFLGHSETVLGLNLPLVQLAPSIYRKI